MIRPIQRDWDEALVRAIFFNHEAEQVLRICIPIREMNDEIAWFYDKNGMFTVRSAYRVGVLNSVQTQNAGGTSSSRQGGRPCWDELWSSPMPQKIKIFAWRLANNGLATLDNRKKRNMEVDSTCCICR